MTKHVTPVDDLLPEVRAFLRAREQAVIELACALIAAPSPNLPGDETAPAAVMEDALASLGLSNVRRLAKEPHRPNLIVEIPGAKPGPRLAICGHLDTKPVGEAAAEWKTDPLTPTIIGDRLYGLGSTDMKGACAAMVYAGAAFASVADRAAGSLTLVFTADEEYGSKFGAQYLAETKALDVDAMILGEPSGVREDWDGLRIVSRGFSGFRVLVRTTQMHSSISDEFAAVNANEAMAKVLTAMREAFVPRYPSHPLAPNGPTVNLAVKVMGGVGYGVLAGHAEFWSDVRLTPGMDLATFREDLEGAVAHAASTVPGSTVELEFTPGLAWYPATEVTPDHAVVRACQAAANRELGSEMPLAMFPGGTDAVSFQGVAGIPTIAAFGPGMLPLAHGSNEWVSVRSIGQASRMYADAALLFGAGGTV